MNNVKITAFEVLFFQFFNSPVALQNKNKIVPQRKSWNDAPEFHWLLFHVLLGLAIKISYV